MRDRKKSLFLFPGEKEEEEEEEEEEDENREWNSGLVPRSQNGARKEGRSNAAVSLANLVKLLFKYTYRRQSATL